MNRGRRIPGVMDYSLLTDKARLLHRPTDADGLRAAAMELQAAGLTVTDIAQALGIGEGAVQQLLQAGEAP